MMRGIARLETVPDHIREWALGWWCRSGSHYRLEVGDDRVLLDALRVLLPAYDGPAVQLYRGDGARSRRGPSYGPAWSSERDVAEAHALGLWRGTPGGSVLLSTFAPAEAIMCNVGAHNNDYGEDEYLVDRRRLGRVDVLNRYSQIDANAIESDEL